jgi:hypothetical protein
MSSVSNYLLKEEIKNRKHEQRQWDVMNNSTLVSKKCFFCNTLRNPCTFWWDPVLSFFAALKWIHDLYSIKMSVWIWNTFQISLCRIKSAVNTGRSSRFRVF